MVHTGQDLKLVTRCLQFCRADNLTRLYNSEQTHTHTHTQVILPSAQNVWIMHIARQSWHVREVST
jgi:hypothetical protein